MTTKLKADFFEFAKAEIRTNDIDPAYPMLKEVFRRDVLPMEIKIWRLVLFVAFYHLGSAEKIWTRFPSPGPLTNIKGTPTGADRRGFRGNDLAAYHVAEVLKRANGKLKKWLETFVGSGGTAGWKALRAEFQNVPYAGPWASYKLCELTKHVLGYPLDAEDIGVGGNGRTAGPVAGMVRLTGLTWEECVTDVGAQHALMDEAKRAGVPYDGLDRLETTMCDFNALCAGRYYVGADIDTQMIHLRGASKKFWEARKVFPDANRGELSGAWDGPRQSLKKLYRDEGILLL